MSPLHENVVIGTGCVPRGYSLPGDTAQAVKERRSPNGNPRERLQDKSYISRVESKVCLLTRYIRYIADERQPAFLELITFDRRIRAD